MAESTARRGWTREEALAALALYCQIPFGRMHSNNPDVQELANRLARTASSVALKLVNFASLDPEHQERGVSGMSHVSKLDREVWGEFYGKWDVLADLDVASAPLDEVDEVTAAETESLAITRVRRGQRFFRRTVLAAYGCRCCVTGIASIDLIRASHIVPWAAQASTRLDPRNGLALNALHDAAFDRGLIAFDDDRRLLLSVNLRVCVAEPEYATFFGQYAGAAMKVPERFAPRTEYLEYHRDNIFRK